MALPGYMLNAEGGDYHYISISRLHSRRAAPNPSGTPCLQQPSGGDTGTALGQAGQEGSSEPEGSELHHASCVLPEPAQGLWGWPESETHVVPDTGNPICEGSHAQDEVRDALGGKVWDTVVTESRRMQEYDWTFFDAVFLVIFATLPCVQVPVLSLEQSRALGHDSLEESALETTIQSLPSSSSEKGNSEKSPLVTPSVASLADSVTHGREGRSCECRRDVPQPH